MRKKQHSTRITTSAQNKPCKSKPTSTQNKTKQNKTAHQNPPSTQNKSKQNKTAHQNPPSTQNKTNPANQNPQASKAHV
jgi:hypothetical protein